MRTWVKVALAIALVSLIAGMVWSIATFPLTDDHIEHEAPHR